VPALSESRLVAFSSCGNFLRGRRGASASFGECRMKHIEKSPASDRGWAPSQSAGFSSPVRTGELITKSGTWRSECAREGCRAVEHLELGVATPAPPCIRCCNPTTLHFVRPPAPVVDGAREGTIAGLHHFTTRLASARFGDITQTWPRHVPPAPAEKVDLGSFPGGAPSQLLSGI